MGEVSLGITSGGARREHRLVTSGVLTFGQLVRLERRVRRLRVVRGLRLEDFRNGVATHVARLRLPLTAQELAELLRGENVAVEAVRGDVALELQLAQESGELPASGVA